MEIDELFKKEINEIIDKTFEESTKKIMRELECKLPYEYIEKECMEHWKERCKSGVMESTFHLFVRNCRNSKKK